MWIDVSGDGISETLEDPGDVLLEPPPFDPPEPPTPFFLGGEMTACAGGWSSSGECGWWLPLASEPVDDRGDRVGGDLLATSPPVLCEPGRNASSEPPPSLARSAMDSSGMCSSPTTSGSGEGDEGRPAPRVGEVLKVFTGLGLGRVATRLGEPDGTSRPSVRPMRSMSESSV